MMKSWTRNMMALTSLAALSLGACGNDQDSDTDGAGGAGGAGEEGPLYLVGARIFSPDGADVTSYYHLVGSLAEGTEVDPSEALEKTGSAKLFSIADEWFALGEADAPTITRYSADSGELASGKSLSLENQGVLTLWDTLYPVSATKAYYPDRDNQQLVIINPKDMTVEGAIQLPDTAREGFLSLYGYRPIRRGNLLLVSVGWFDWNVNDTILEETGLVVIDTETDEVVRYDVDERCGGVTTPLQVESGDTYLVSSALAAAAYRLERIETAPCALKIPADSDAIDPDYLLELGELTDDALAGEPVPATGNELFLRVLDEEGITVDDESKTWNLTGAPQWQWWRWNVETGEATRVEALTPSTSDVFWFEVDGKVFGTETKADYSETTLIELTASGGPKKGLTVPGFLSGLTRVR